MENTVTIHMVASLDGFIARKDNDISWLTSNDDYPQGVTLSDAEIATFLERIDCYVMGSHTYEHALVLGWPYGDTPVMVITSRPMQPKRESVQFYSGDLTSLLNNKLKPSYSNIWLVGGAMLVKEFIRLKLADEIIISIMPVLLGGGTPFFDELDIEQSLHLKDVVSYRNGMVELWYEIIN